MLGFESGKSGTVKYFSYIRADSVTSFWIPSMAICWMLSYACKICTYTTWGYYHQRICKTCWVLVSMTRCSEFQIESGTGSGYSWVLWIKTVTMTHIFFINKLSLFRLSDLGGGFDDAGWSSQYISSSNGKLSVKKWLFQTSEWFIASKDEVGEGFQRHCNQCYSSVTGWQPPCKLFTHFLFSSSTCWQYFH